MSARSRKPGPRVRSRWFDTSTVGGIIFGESLTRQEFQPECDINLILARYDESPPRPWRGSPPQLRYGDFAEAPDFLSAQLLVKQAEDQFHQLPVAMRERFQHSPVEFLRFVHDPKNRDEGVRLGIFKAPEPPPPAPPPATP